MADGIWDHLDIGADRNGSIVRQPEEYDLLFSSFQQDVEFWLKVTEHSVRVLECGTGTARLLIPLLQHGRTVEGFDASTGMVDYALRKIAESGIDLPRIQKTDFAAFRADGTFDTIIVPFMTWNYLLSSVERSEALRNLSSHMSHCGSLWIELFTRNTVPDLFFNDGMSRLVVHRPVAGGILQVYRTTSYDPDTQLVQQIRNIKKFDESGQLVAETLMTWRNTYIEPTQFKTECENAGLSVEEMFGDYDGRPLEDDSRLYIAKMSRRR